MSKKVSYWFVIGIGLLLLSGCSQLVGDEDFYELKVPEKKVKQIEILDLEEVKTKTPPAVDSNQIGAKEVTLTLEQCRALTLENNLDLKVQLIAPAIAAQNLSEQEAKFEAAFYSNLAFVKTDTLSSTSLTASKSEYAAIDFGVEVPLRTGGTINFDMVDSRTKTNNQFATVNPSYASDASISISQPLLKNAGKRASTYAIRIADYERQITDARTKLEVIRVIADVDRWYWRLYAARRELDVRQKQYDLAKTLLDQAQRFVDAGEKALIEVIRAEAGVAERLEAIIISENNLRDRQRELKKLLNQPDLKMQTLSVLVPATEPDPIHYQLEGKPLVEKAIENRMEMLELELQIAADAATIDYQQNQTLPLVTLDYQYNINGLGPTRSDSYDLLYDKRFEDHSLGLSLLVPLGNQAAKSQLLRAFYERQQRLSSKENRKLAIELEVLNAVDQLEANWQRILASRQNSILAGRLFEAEKRHFKLGLGTSTDVLDAQTTFADAQSAEISALADYQIALVDLAYATGTLLGAAKVQWQPLVPETN